MIRRVLLALLIAAAPSFALGQTLGNPRFQTVTIGGFTISGVGTAAGTVAAGNDSRIIGALQAATAATTYAPLNSPNLTGAPTAPNPNVGDTSNRIATASMVTAAVQGASGSGVSSSALDSAFGSTQGSVLYRGTSAWTTLTPGTAGYLLQAGGSGANISWVAPPSSSTALPATSVRLNYTSATALTMTAIDGASLYVNGANRAISGNVTLSNSGLAASTAYYVYDSYSGSAHALLASTTAPAVDATTGLKFMSGNSAYTLVGATVTNASSQFQPAPLTSSYFNRREQVGTSAATSSSTSGTTSAELSTSGRVSAWVWGDEALDVDVRGTGYQNTSVSGHYGFMQAATDAGTLGGISQAGGIGSTSAYWPFTSRVVTKPGADGLRYGTAYGYNDGGGFTAYFTLTIIVKTRG